MKKIILIFCSILFSVFTFTKSLNDIQTITEKYISNKTMPGAVVLVSKNGHILYNKAFGYAQVLEDDKEKLRPMKIDTIFDLASLTKIFATTQAIMKLVSEGKISVNDKVSKYIPEFAKNGKEDVKIKDLLTHTSGLTPWLPTYYYVKNSDEELKYICNLPLEYKTGSNRKYSDFSFMTLAFIVEKVTHKKLNDYVLEEIYKPLHLKRTRFLPLEVFSQNQIASTSHGNPFEQKMIYDDNFGYKINEEYNSFRYWRRHTLTGLVNDGNSYYANNGVAGHAGLFSTAHDLYVLGEVLLNNGKYKSVRLYNKNVIDEFTKIESKFGHGYGYEINRGGVDKGYMGKYATNRFVGHTGFTGTQVVYDLDNKIQVIILTNKQNYGVDSDGSYKSTWKYAREIMNLVGDVLYKK